jgi:hypothetical protein
MVMKVEIRHDDSFMSLPDGDVQVVLIEINYSAVNSSSSSSSYYNARDTSDTCRGDTSMDNTRQTVNTYDSILDLTKDEEDDDDDDDDDEEDFDQSFLFDDLHIHGDEFNAETNLDEHGASDSLILSPAHTAVAAAPQKNRQAPGERCSSATILDSVTDSFVDSLCFDGANVASSSSRSCVPRLPSCHQTGCSVSTSSCSNNNATNRNRGLQAPRLQIGVDVLQLLGCSSRPGDDELEEIWAVRTAQMLEQAALAAKRPPRSSLKERMKKIHRLRMERFAESAPTRHGVNVSSPNSVIGELRTAYTMDERFPGFSSPEYTSSVGGGDPLADMIGKGLEPIFPLQDTGYDSDPELSSAVDGATANAHYNQSSLMNQEEDDHHKTTTSTTSSNNPDFEDRRIQQTVQVCVKRERNAERFLP